MASYGSRAEMPPDVDPSLYHARSHGRTPAEHAALEAQLARRRAESRARVGPVRAASTPSRRPGPYTTSPSSLPQQRQQQSPSPAPRDGRTKAQIRAALLGPFGYVRRHPLRGQTNRGSGWHKKGYRSCGDMWINVKRSSVSYRGEDFDENMTLASFVRRIQSRSICFCVEKPLLRRRASPSLCRGGCLVWNQHDLCWSTMCSWSVQAGRLPLLGIARGVIRSHLPGLTVVILSSTQEPQISWPRKCTRVRTDEYSTVNRRPRRK